MRRWYRRVLALVRARGGRLSPTMNTLQIQRENADTVSPDAMGALREVYLPVRYGERPASREDVARAGEAYSDAERMNWIGDRIATSSLRLLAMTQHDGNANFPLPPQNSHSTP